MNELKDPVHKCARCGRERPFTEGYTRSDDLEKWFCSKYCLASDLHRSPQKQCAIPVDAPLMRQKPYGERSAWFRCQHCNLMTTEPESPYHVTENACVQPNLAHEWWPLIDVPRRTTLVGTNPRIERLYSAARAYAKSYEAGTGPLYHLGCLAVKLEEAAVLYAILARAKPNVPTFEEAWAEKEKEGYQYGEDALQGVRFGWKIRDRYARFESENLRRVAELANAHVLAEHDHDCNDMGWTQAENFTRHALVDALQDAGELKPVADRAAEMAIALMFAEWVSKMATRMFWKTELCANGIHSGDRGGCEFCGFEERPSGDVD